MRVGILEPYRFSTAALEELEKVSHVDFFVGGQIKKFVQDKEALFVRLKYYLGRKILQGAKSLRYICSPTTGLNHIDLEETFQRKIKVISLQGERDFLMNIRATPEHAVGLVLALLRNYHSAFLRQGHIRWDRQRYIGSEIFEKTIGIIGFGRVGRILAKYFSCFGARVCFFDVKTNMKSADGAQRSKSMEQLISRSDIVILCASWQRKNMNLIGKKYIDLLKGKFFINISRGDLVEEDYLFKKIQQGHFRGVALDVLKGETDIRPSRLKQLVKRGEGRNLILTPHIGGATVESMGKSEIFIVEKFKKEIRRGEGRR